MATIGIEWANQYHGRASNLKNNDDNARGFFNTLQGVKRFDFGDDLAVPAANDGVADHHDAVGVTLLVGRPLLRRGPLSVQSAQGDVPCLLPLTRQLHPERMA